MSVDLYEHYKEALRRGHMALARGLVDEALAAYREAIALAPERALPHAGLGQALLRQGAATEALAAFEAVLIRSPRDETGLRGRAEALARLGHRTDAAETLDVLADVQEAAGRIGDAGDTTRRALDLAEQKARRRRLQDLTRRVRLQVGDQPADQALANSLRPLGPGDESRAAADAAATAALEARDAHEAAAAEADLEAALATQSVPVAPPPDPIALIARAESALDAGDIAPARSDYLAAAAAFTAEGSLNAALDACYVALAFAPDDADVHLQLVELYLERGWNGPAAEKLALLGRLTELDDRQGRARARIVVLAADHFPDDPRLRRLSAQGAPRP